VWTPPLEELAPRYAMCLCTTRCRTANPAVPARLSLLRRRDHPIRPHAGLDWRRTHCADVATVYARRARRDAVKVRHPSPSPHMGGVRLDGGDVRATNDANRPSALDAKQSQHEHSGACCAYYIYLSESTLYSPPARWGHDRLNRMRHITLPVRVCLHGNPPCFVVGSQTAARR
jgi:hypothetical protein